MPRRIGGGAESEIVAGGGLGRGRFGERAVLLVGLASAVVLAWAGWRLTAEPDRAGEAALARAAGEVADGVVAEWQRLLRRPDPPGAGADPLDTWGTDQDWSWLSAVPRLPAGEHPAFDALLAEASLAEAERGDIPGALHLVVEALARTGLDDVRRLAGHLRAIQLGGRLGRPDVAAHHWDEAARLGRGDEATEDVSLLLACALAAGPHLPAADRHAAAERLATLWLCSELALPTPGSGGAGQQARRVAWRGRLLDMLPEGSSLATTLTAKDRADLARLSLQERFGALPEAPEDDRWHLAVEGDAVLVYRARNEGGSEGTATTADRVLAALAGAVRDHGLLPPGFVLDLGARDDDAATGPAEGLVVREAVALGSGPWSFTLRHTDPDAVMASEQARQRAVRIGMFVMAAACLGAAALTARSLRRERALAGLKSAFVASVSHELRTPVASILLMAENLEQGRITDDDGRRRYHGHIRAEAHRLRRLVDDVLDFSRLERGRPPHLALEPVDLDALADDIEGEARRRVAAAGLALESRRGALPTSAVLDAEAVRRAVLNLVDNAVRHSGSPVVELVIEQAAEPSAGAPAAASGAASGAAPDGASEGGQGVAGHLRIVVADRGRGVPADRRRSIFAPFERLDEQRPGTGLGLPIVQAIARGHGGDVLVSGRPDGPGAWFELRLPVAHDAVSQPAGEVGT